MVLVNKQLGPAGFVRKCTSIDGLRSLRAVVNVPDAGPAPSRKNACWNSRDVLLGSCSWIRVASSTTNTCCEGTRRIVLVVGVTLWPLLHTGEVHGSGEECFHGGEDSARVGRSVDQMCGCWPRASANLLNSVTNVKRRLSTLSCMFCMGLEGQRFMRSIGCAFHRQGLLLLIERCHVGYP